VVHAHRISPRKPAAGRSKRYKRLSHGVRLLSSSVGGHESAAGASGTKIISVAVPACPGSNKIRALVPIMATTEEQLGLNTRHAVSLADFNGIRRGLGGSRVGLASISALRASRQPLAGRPSNGVLVNSSGAHFVSIHVSVHANLAALSASNSVVDRLLRAGTLQPIEQTEAYKAPSVIDPEAGSTAPPASVKDVHLKLGFDKGGDPSSVKIFMGVVNQSGPQSLSKSILVSVCPANRYKCEEVADLLSEHLAQVIELVHVRVVVGGVRRMVRLLLTGDYEGLRTLHGSKGPSATIPCLGCLSLKAPSSTHAALEENFGAINDVYVLVPAHPRSAYHLVQFVAAGAPGSTRERRIADMSQTGHLSIDRQPLFTIDLRQIVPIPSHQYMGITLWLLRLAVETVVSFRGWGAGEDFSHELVETIRRIVRVGPAPYHGGVFIGPDCCTIAHGRDAVCRTIPGLVP